MSPRPESERGVTTVGRLLRLLDEVEELNRELERLEAKTQEAVGRSSRPVPRKTAEAQ